MPLGGKQAASRAGSSSSSERAEVTRQLLHVIASTPSELIISQPVFAPTSVAGALRRAATLAIARSPATHCFARFVQIAAQPCASVGATFVPGPCVACAISSGLASSSQLPLRDEVSGDRIRLRS